MSTKRTPGAKPAPASTEATPGGVAPKSLLSRGAPEPGEPPPGPPWFKDQRKLLAAVVELAETDPSFALEVAAAVAAIAQRRPRVRNELGELLKAEKAGNRSIPLSEHLKLLHLYDALRRDGLSYDECIERIEVLLNVAEPTAKARLTKARKAAAQISRSARSRD